MLELRHVIDQTGFDMVDYAKIESNIRQRLRELDQERDRCQRILDALSENGSVALPIDAAPLENNLHEDGSKALPNRLKADSLAILRSLNGEALSLDALEQACKKRGFTISRSSLINRLSAYKRDYKFVEIPQPGLYQLSDRAIQFLNERYPEKEKPEEVTMTES